MDIPRWYRYGFSLMCPGSKGPVNSLVQGLVVNTCDLALSAQAGQIDHLLEPLAPFPFWMLNEEDISVLILPHFFFLKKFRQEFMRAPAAAGGEWGQATGSLALLLPEGGKLVLYRGRVGVCSGVWPEGWLRWFAHPLGSVECRGQAQYPAFAPGSSEVAVQLFFFFFWSFCIFCPESAPTVCTQHCSLAAQGSSPSWTHSPLRDSTTFN